MEGYTMRRRVGRTILFGFILLVFISTGFAQQTFKVAVINSIKTLQNSEEGKKAIAQLEDKEQKIKDNMANIEKEILGLETKLKSQRLLMTFEAQEQLKLDLDNLRTRYKRVEEDGVKEFERLKFRLFGKIIDELRPIIHTVAKEKKFSLVLDVASECVMYFDASTDITNEVIERYNSSKALRK